MWLLELTADEQAEVWQLVAQARSALAEQFHPTGCNIGVNDG
jgi:diadenosine tetraphosphate (Ap4A) HIT family hydrolase